MRQKIEKYDHDLKIQYSNIELWTIANNLCLFQANLLGATKGLYRGVKVGKFHYLANWPFF